MASETNAIARMAASCARQGYRPIFTAGSSIYADRWKDDVNLRDHVAGVPQCSPTSKPAHRQRMNSNRLYGPMVAEM